MTAGARRVVAWTVVVAPCGSTTRLPGCAAPRRLLFRFESNRDTPCSVTRITRTEQLDGYTEWLIIVTREHNKHVKACDRAALPQRRSHSKPLPPFRFDLPSRSLTYFIIQSWEPSITNRWRKSFHGIVTIPSFIPRQVMRAALWSWLFCHRK